MRSDRTPTDAANTDSRRQWSRAPRGATALLVAVLVSAGAALPATAAAVSLQDKRAQAAKVAAQVSKLEGEYDHLQERWRGAQFRLDTLDRRVTRLSSDLLRTQGQLNVAQDRLVTRAITVYTAGSGTTRLLNLAQAGSVTNFLDRMDTIQRVGEQDADILVEIKRLRERVARKRGQLKEARAEQVVVVRQAARDKQSMGRKLQARQKVLSSVNGEIRSMVEAQRRAEAARAAAAARASASAARSTGDGGAASPGRPAQDDAGVAAPAAGGDTGTSIQTPAAAPPASGSAASAASIAMGYIGTPYRWGGASPSGFDCSGLVMYAFGKVGISLPHSTYALWNAGPHVSRDQLQTGDLVFFSGLGHMGIYVGGGSYVHAPQTGDFVKVSSLYDSYATRNWVGAVRITR